MREKTADSKLGYLRDPKTAADIITAGGMVDGAICIICQERFRCPEAFGPDASLFCPRYALDEGDPESIEHIITDVLTQT